MTETIDGNYTEDQIRRAKSLFDILELRISKIKKGKYITLWGYKTKEGVINTILNIMFGGGR